MIYIQCLEVIFHYLNIFFEIPEPMTRNKQESISKSGNRLSKAQLSVVHMKLPDQTTEQIYSENTIPSSNNQLATPRQERTSHQSTPMYFVNFVNFWLILYSFLNQHDFIVSLQQWSKGSQQIPNWLRT